MSLSRTAAMRIDARMFGHFECPHGHVIEHEDAECETCDQLRAEYENR